MLETNYFYFIKDSFYEEFSDCGLMANVPSDERGQHNRPCYYCLSYEKMFWMIPISSRLEKYERIYEEKMSLRGKCDGIKFGYVNGEKRAFLLQNIFPVTAEYVDKMYKINRNTVPVTVNDKSAQELNKTARKILRMYKRGVKIMLTDLDKIIGRLKHKSQMFGGIAMNYKLWDFFRELQTDYELVDLTHPLDNDSPYWSGIPEGSVELGKVCFDWGNPMLECLVQTFKFPGQFGTHIDFPAHFIKGAAGSDSYGTSSMIYPLCVVDISAKVTGDVHYAATSDDIKAYEKIYGAIPDGAFVALRSGWAKHWPDANAINGIADDGSENFPGWSLDALKYIYETRNAAANGHETLDTDASAVAAEAGDLVCERYLMSKGKLQVEVMNNLDKVAPAGALLFVAWPNITGATGLPARLIAITPKA